MARNMFTLQNTSCILKLTHPSSSVYYMPSYMVQGMYSDMDADPLTIQQQESMTCQNEEDRALHLFTQ